MRAIWARAPIHSGAAFLTDPNNNFDVRIEVTAVSEPWTLLLFAAGMAGLGLRRWRVS